jgi:hypothetical protein
MAKNYKRYPSQRWAFTICDNQRDIVMDEDHRKNYRMLFEQWEKCDTVHVRYCYEEKGEKLNILHLHGTVEMPKGFYRKMLMLPGYHIKLKLLESDEAEQGWIEYACKSGNQFQ